MVLISTSTLWKRKGCRRHIALGDKQKIQNEKTAAASISFLLPSRSRSRSPPTSPLFSSSPISLSLSLSLTHLPASHKAATKASEIATNHGAVLLGRRPPAQPARAQQTLLVMAPRRSIPMEANTSGGVPSEFFAGLERAGPARHNALI